MNGILPTIKEMLGITSDYTHFDVDIIAHINTAIVILHQMGVTTNGFMVKDSSDEWLNLIPSQSNLDLIKTYIFLKVKLIFDPPLSSGAIEAMKQLISELEWRISVTVDPSTTFE